MTILEAANEAWKRLVDAGSIVPDPTEDIETQKFRWRRHELIGTFDLDNLRKPEPFTTEQIIQYFQNL